MPVAVSATHVDNSIIESAFITAEHDICFALFTGNVAASIAYFERDFSIFDFTKFEITFSEPQYSAI